VWIDRTWDDADGIQTGVRAFDDLSAGVLHASSPYARTNDR
jgi:hypothetical protein